MTSIEQKNEEFVSEQWHNLRNRLDAILAKHNAYNNRKDSRYSRQILSSLNFALFAATCAINSAYNEALSKKSLSPIILAVSFARTEYQPDNEDEGYGRGCLGSVLNSLHDLQKEFISNGLEQPIAKLPTPKTNNRLRAREEKIGIERIAKEFGFSKIELLRGNKATPEEIVFKVWRVSSSNLDAHFFSECRNALSRLLGVEITLVYDSK